MGPTRAKSHPSSPFLFGGQLSCRKCPWFDKSTLLPAATSPLPGKCSDSLHADRQWAGRLKPKDNNWVGACSAIRLDGLWWPGICLGVALDYTSRLSVFLVSDVASALKGFAQKPFNFQLDNRLQGLEHLPAGCDCKQRILDSEPQANDRTGLLS